MSHAASLSDTLPKWQSGTNRRSWAICWLMFASTVLCYMDRQTISLLKPAITLEFGIKSAETYGWLMAAFMLPYALFQIPAGFLADAGDVRKIYAWAVGGWSVAGLASAFSPTLGILIACRVMLGVGESFNWPCGLRITSRILAPADRGLGNGIFNSGAAVGAVVAPLIIPLIAQKWGWRAAFAAVAGLGLLWVAVWQAVRPSESIESAPKSAPQPPSKISGLALGAFSGLSAASILMALATFTLGPNAIVASLCLLMLGALIVARLLPESSLVGPRWLESLGAITRRRRFWVMLVVAITVNVCWHYLVSWMADFFQTDRKLGMVRGAMVSALPFLAADAGNLFGGSLSRSLTRKGVGLFRARATIMTIGAVLVACGTTVGLIQSTSVIVVIISIMAVGTAAIMANYFALCQDVDTRHTGLVVGVLGGMGNLFAAGFQPLAGRLKDLYLGAGVNFAIVGCLPMIGLIVLWIGWGRDRDRVEANPS